MISIPIHDLHLRRKSIVSLLRPLIKTSTIPTEIIPRNKENIIVAFSGTKISDNYRDWTFRSFTENVICQYFEIWRPNKKDPQSLFLDRAYLNLFMVDIEKRSQKEFVCLHCDPEATDNKYKKGPHLHIKMASDPLPKSHFPLNHCHINDILVSLDTLTTAISSAVLILKDEVLSKCN